MANWIHDIEIKNFKSIRQARVEDCRRVNVFIGYPNVGKSNILEALSGFSFLNEKTFSAPSLQKLIRYNSFTDLFFNREVAESINVRINGEDNLTFLLVDLERLDIIITGQGPVQKLNNGISKREGMTHFVGIFSPSGHNQFRHLQELEHSGKSLVRMYKFKSDVVYQTGRSLALSIPFGENLGDIFEVYPNFAKECNEVLVDYGLNIEIEKRGGQSKPLLRKLLRSGVTMSIDWDLIADTIQRVFFYQAAIKTNQNNVLLFEEPEAHMFPPYISKFTTDIIQDENRNQFFIATHSPFVLNDFMENLTDNEFSIFVVGFKKETGETVIRRLADEEITEIYQYGIDLFFNLEMFLKDAV